MKKPSEEERKELAELKTARGFLIEGARFLKESQLADANRRVKEAIKHLELAKLHGAMFVKLSERLTSLLKKTSSEFFGADGKLIGEHKLAVDSARYYITVIDTCIGQLRDFSKFCSQYENIHHGTDALVDAVGKCKEMWSKTCSEAFKNLGSLIENLERALKLELQFER